MSDQLRSFLHGIGLSDYYDTFSTERIELDDLGLMSDSDLARLGLPLGPRRRLMRAVTAENGAEGGARQAQPGGPVQERRNLTVLFCDMVDSTSVATRVDPEDLRSRFHVFREACEAAIEAEDGFVAHRMGDGLMAHFGFPAALEDAAFCAVRAGLEIVARAATLEAPGGAIAVRVGIASGLTVTEKARSGVVENDEIVTGATLALAARLQALAEPGEVVISDATRILLRNAIALSPLGPKAIKGFADRQVVWLATGQSANSLAAGDVPLAGVLLGRQAEYSKLLDMWGDCRKGKGGAVVIDGDPGIGKSRLLGELRRAASPDADMIVLHCHRHRHGAALHPVTDWLETIIGSDDISRHLAVLPGIPPENVPLIEWIMGRGADGGGEAEPLQRQAAIIEAVVSVLAATAGLPKMVLVEDLHWADTDTLAVLGQLAARSGEMHLLVAATTRPLAGTLPAGFHRISLAPLPPSAIDALIAGQDGAAKIPEVVRRIIAARSGGVPLFAEELTRATLEAPEAGSAAVPFTLQDTLMARLDRLAVGKPVAQVGALLGLNFTPDLLKACSDLPEVLVHAGLAELLATNLLEMRPGRQQTYSFRHSLVRDVAYESLLLSRRVVLHRQVAETIETLFPLLAEAQPERVAQHYAEGGVTEAAVRFWEKAAELAISKAAPASAIENFRSALKLLLQGPSSPERDSREAGLRIRLNMPLTVVTGFASTETEENLSHMGMLLENLEAGKAVLQLLWSRSMSRLVRADLVAARKTALQLDRAAERARVPNVKRMPQRILGYVAMLEGRLDEAETHFLQVLEGYAPREFDPILQGHPFDALAASLSQHAILMALRDQPDAVDEDQARALKRARAFDDPATSFQVLVHLCIARIELGDHGGLAPLLAELHDLVDHNEITPLYVNIWEALVMARKGALESGLAEMARARKDSVQYALWMPRMSLMRVELLDQAGRHSEALESLDACDAEIAQHRHTYLLAEARRRRALCREALGASDAEVVAFLSDAVAIARRQGARRFERVARQDLERFLGDRGSLAGAPT